MSTIIKNNFVKGAIERGVNVTQAIFRPGLGAIEDLKKLIYGQVVDFKNPFKPEFKLWHMRSLYPPLETDTKIYPKGVLHAFVKIPERLFASAWNLFVAESLPVWMIACPINVFRALFDLKNTNVKRLPQEVLPQDKKVFGSSITISGP